MKGYATFTIGRLIELILVVVVIAVILFMVAPQAWGWMKTNVFNPITGQGIPLGSHEASTLEAAIKCSYLRCSDGCGKDSVKNIDIGTKNCDTDYCAPFQQGGKVCGSNAQSHPIPVTLFEDQTLDKAKINKGNLGTCITTSDGCTPANIDGYVTIDKAGTTDKAWEEVKCSIYGFIQITGYSRILINAGKYNVWTNNNKATGVCLANPS